MQSHSQEKVVLLNGGLDKISVGNVGAFPQQGSLSFFMKLNMFNGFDNAISTNYGGCGNRGIRFEFCNGCPAYVVVGDTTCGYDVHTIAAAGVISINAWHHFTLTWDVALNNVRGYLDGKLIFDEANSHWDSNLGNVQLGSGYFNRPLNGYLDDITIWQKRLTQTEITNLTQKIINTSDADLRAFWSFNTNTINGENQLVPNMAVSTSGSYNAITQGTSTTPIFETPINTYYQDADGDGYGNANVSISSSSLLAPAGYVSNNRDCDDTNASIYPGKPGCYDKDDCQGAQPLTVTSSCTPSTFSSVGATASVGAPTPTCGFYQGGDVWFRAVVPASGNIRVEVNGLSGYYAQYAIYTGVCNALTQYSCNQLDPYVTISDPALASKTIYIRVYGYNSAAGGSFDICAWEPPVPANDNCANAILVSAGTSCLKNTFTNAYATAQPTSVAANPTCGFYQGGDVWFKFIAPASGKIRLEFEGSTGSNPQYALYSGTCGSFNQVFCGQLDPEHTIHNPSLGGQMLYLRVFGYNSKEGGTFKFCVWEPPIPANNDCANATPITVGTFCNPAITTNMYATSDSSSVAPYPSCGFYQGGDVWYTVVVPASGKLTIQKTDLPGSLIQFALYSGTCGAFTEIACAHLTTTMVIDNPSLAGQTLYVRAFSYNGDEGGNYFLTAYEVVSLSCIDSLYNGGGGNGFSYTLGLITQPGAVDSIYSGGLGDGFSNVLSLLNIAGVIDSLYSGGSGDGFSNVLGFINIAGIIDSSYSGGLGDGFSNVLGFINIAGVIDSLYTGGTSDGFSSGIGLLTNAGIIDSLYSGGSGDGFSKTSAIIIVAGIADSMYAGGAGRGENMFAADLVNLSLCGPVIAWNGKVSNVWGDPANWDCGIVPGINSKVYLPAGLARYPAITTSAEIKSLIIHKGATIMIMPNVNLKITGHD